MFDVEVLSRDLMRALRGERSQPAFSKSLGFRSNAAYLWEHGRRYPEVSSFLKAALAVKQELGPLLARFFEQPRDTFAGRRGHSPRNVTRLVVQLIGDNSKGDIATQLGVDRTTLSRWCAGKTEPRLPQFLGLVQLMTQRLIEFIALFVELADVPSMRELHTYFLRQRRLAYELPRSHAVLRALELDAYRTQPAHDPALLAREAGVEEAEVGTCLAELENAGQVVRGGSHYESAKILTIDTRQDPARNARLKAFWAREALERFETGHTGSETLFSFNLFAVSEEGFQHIRRLHLAYYDQARAIIEQSKSADRVVLMNLQLMPLRAPQTGEIAPESRPHPEHGIDQNASSAGQIRAAPDAFRDRPRRSSRA
jgi:transcriptional regulator with XRE-family HTH domain